MTEYSPSTWLSTKLIPEDPKMALLTDQDNIPKVMVLAPFRNQTGSNLILSADRLRRYDEIQSDAAPNDVAGAYRKLNRENIDYDSLVIVYSHDRELIDGIVDGIVDLILETVVCSQEYILIASIQYQYLASVVKRKFLKLNYSHIGYALSCLWRNTSKVNNIKTYLLAALFNAPSTIDSYYQAEVHHDIPELAVILLAGLVLLQRKIKDTFLLSGMKLHLIGGHKKFTIIISTPY